MTKLGGLGGPTATKSFMRWNATYGAFALLNSIRTPKTPSTTAATRSIEDFARM